MGERKDVREGIRDRFYSEDAGKRDADLVREGVNPDSFDEVERHYFLNGFLEENGRNLGRKAEILRIWGFRRMDLRRFSYGALENFFYAYHNIDVPIEMKDALNADEILAEYFGSLDLKQWDRHKNAGLPGDFEGLNERIIQSGKGNVKRLCLTSRKTYPDSFLGINERLRGVSEDSKRKFVDSFFEDYRWPMHEVKSGRSFYDPNIDGKDKMVYVNFIFDFLNKEWDFRGSN